MLRDSTGFTARVYRCCGKKGTSDKVQVRQVAFEAAEKPVTDSEAALDATADAEPAGKLDAASQPTPASPTPHPAPPDTSKASPSPSLPREGVAALPGTLAAMELQEI